MEKFNYSSDQNKLPESLTHLFLTANPNGDANNEF